MRKSNRINFTVTGALFFLFAIFTIMLMYVDVQPIGPEGSCVGLATVNRWVSELLGVNMLLYHITEEFRIPKYFLMGKALKQALHKKRWYEPSL